MRTLGVRELRGDLCRRIDLTHRRGEIVVVTRRGRPVAALVPTSVLELAQAVGQALPDVQDVADTLQGPVAAFEREDS